MSGGCDAVELSGLLLREVVVIEQGGGERCKSLIALATPCRMCRLSPARAIGWQRFSASRLAEHAMRTPVVRSLPGRIWIGDMLLPDDRLVRVDDAAACTGGTKIEA